ncbi:MAG TPA: DUF4265 domain-containing protein [Acidobacteriota bacterium]|nr:DUF4265 domain-containing protein [Acidobacteriota bacterium]
MILEGRNREAGRQGGLVKIDLPLDASGYEDQWSVERVWAEKVGPGGYRLRNSPFYSYGLSFGDVVSVKAVEDKLEFDAVLRRSGHSTYRIFFAGLGDSEARSRALSGIGTLVCSYERATANLYAIDVHADSDIQAVYQYLVKLEKEGIWEFEEGHCGHSSAATANWKRARGASLKEGCGKP